MIANKTDAGNREMIKNWNNAVRRDMSCADRKQGAALVAEMDDVRRAAAEFGADIRPRKADTPPSSVEKNGSSAPTVFTHNGIFTVHNPATGNHRTFRVRTQREDADFAPGKRVLYLLTGPDNERNFTGFAFVDGGCIHVWKSKRGGVYERYAGILANQAKWEANGLEFVTEGRCRRCNRRLTTPASCELGIGPKCAERMAR